MYNKVVCGELYQDAQCGFNADLRTGVAFSSDELALELETPVLRKNGESLGVAVVSACSHFRSH